MGRALLLITGGLMFIFGMIQFSIVERQKHVPERSAEYYNESQARSLAVSLVEMAIEQIRDDPTWVGEFEFDNFLGGQGFVRAYNEDSANKPDSISAGSWDEYKVLLYSEFSYSGEYVETEVLVQRDSYSKYSYFTEYEPSNIYFFSGDEISGPVHTNGTMHIAGEPIFTGMVTSPHDWQGMSGESNNPQFLGGSNFGSDYKDPPDPDQVNKIKSAASVGGLTFNEDISVVFNSNGTATITQDRPYWQGGDITNTYNLSHYNGVISTSGDVKTKGTINGQVTLHSERDIEIIGDLKYNADPRIDTTSNDLLGLVSENDVIVDENAHRDSGNSDLTIHATIMALDNSFRVENYQYGYPRGQINLLGGIIQEERGAVGTFIGNSVNSGFTKSYDYDTRLLEMIPPSYPREKWFSIVYWRDRTL